MLSSWFRSTFTTNIVLTLIASDEAQMQFVYRLCAERAYRLKDVVLEIGTAKTGFKRVSILACGAFEAEIKSTRF